jgi:drug/metabolite transporter (DMT)-like permease
MHGALETHAPVNRVGVVIAFALLYVVWGSTYFAIRVGVQVWPPFTMAGARFVVAGLLPMLVLRARGVPLPTARQWRNALVVGSCLALGGNGLVTWAEQTVSSSVAALLIAITPMWFVLLEALRPGGRAPGMRVLLGLCVGFGGVVFLLGPSELRDELGSPPLVSLFAIVVASLLWAGGSLYGKHHEQPSSVWMWSAAQMLSGGLALCAIALVTGEPSQLTAAIWSDVGLGSVVYLIVFGSWLGFGSYVWLLGRVSPAQLSTYAYVNPIVAVALGATFLGEPVTSGLVQAGLLILGGVILVQLPARASARAS